ncbi:MAG: FHA domain-containing protein [Sandaracinaceae bacterium]|nr:FHA domain-containing protein [Sandaracinaceae bacterium]
MGVRLHVRSLWGPRTGEEVVYEFDQDRILLGRGRGADVCLPHRAVSLRHASIELSGARYAIVDHGSTNGTRVGGARLVPGAPSRSATATASSSAASPSCFARGWPSARRPRPSARPRSRAGSRAAPSVRARPSPRPASPS